LCAAFLRGQEQELPPAMYLMSLASGTSLNPLAWPMPMIMHAMLMLMVVVRVVGV